MKKQILIVLTLTFLLCLLAPLANAAYYEFTYAFSNGNQVLGLIDVFPGSLGWYSAATQSFSGDGNYFYSFTVSMNKTGTPTGYIKAGIWNATVGLVPDDILETSASELNIESLTGTQTQYEFSFTATTTVSLGNTYFFGVWIENGTVGATDHVRLLEDTTSPTGAGNLVGWISDAWSVQATNDLCFSYLTSDVLGGGAGGGSGTGWTDAESDALINNLVSFIVPIVIVFLPVILLATITRSTSKWIIIMGVTIGASLGYFFALVPLWVVFLVVIGLIGMAYQSVRGGG